MSWASVVNKKDNNIKNNVTTKEEVKKEEIVDDENCKENFENKYDLDLYDFCFELKDYVQDNHHLLLNIDSFKIGDFIKNYINYRKYTDSKEDSESENEFGNE